MQENQPNKNKSKNKLIFGLASIFAIIFFFGYIFIKLNNIKVQNQNYSFKSDDEIVKDIVNKFSSTKLNLISDGEKKYSVSLDEIGLNLDKNNLKNEVSNSRKISFYNLKNIFTNNRNISLKYEIDKSKLKKYLSDNFVANVATFKHPTLDYNKDSNSFEIVNGVAGQYIDSEKIFDNFNIKLNQNNDLRINYSQKQPIAVNDQLKQIQAQLNEKLKLRINLNNGKNLVYFADPWDIAAWIEVKVDEDSKQYYIENSNEKIKTFITNNVTKYARQNPVNGKDLYSEDGKFLQTLQAGRKGYGDIKDIDSIAKQIGRAVMKSENIDVDLALQEIPFTNEKVTLKGDKWVEVNLSKQTVILHSGDQVLQTFLISSGLTNPTPPGTFYVWYKTQIQTMTGGSKADGTYYSLPNVTWVTYFNGDIGFHSAYWHNNFGRPMSHGCINMRESDSKILYDFAPIGTTVVVHY